MTAPSPPSKWDPERKHERAYQGQERDGCFSSLSAITRLDLDFLALSAPAATYSMIRRAHERDMKLYAWTIDDPVQMTVMMSRGVDGIITNQVALARQVQDLRAKLTPLGRFVVWMAGEAGLLRGMEKSSARDDA